jgi:hypothetical protein
MLWDSRKPKWNQTHAKNLNIVFCISPVFFRKMTGSGALGARYRDATGRIWVSPHSSRTQVVSALLAIQIMAAKMAIPAKPK